MTFTPHPHSLTAQLDREWARLRRQPRSLRRARAWTGLEPEGLRARELAELSDLQTIVDLTRGGGASDCDADAVLCRLVELAANDDLAGRIVIQRILPGLIARSARYRSHRDGIDPIEIVVAAAWIALRDYDWRRRRRHVAASLISDATFQAFRRPLRLKAATEATRPPHTFRRIEDRGWPSNATDELVLVLRTARAAGVPAPDLELIRHLVRTGSPGAVARECGVTPRTIRNRREVAIARVRAALEAA